MIGGVKATSKYDEESSKVVPFPDPVENLQKTLNLLKLPEDVALNTKSLGQLHSKIDALQDLIVKFIDNIELGDRYMTPKEACMYLGMSETTFDKYRYSTKIKIKGYKLDGKTWYRKSDLDLFMLTYNTKSQGFA